MSISLTDLHNQIAALQDIVSSRLELFSGRLDSIDRRLSNLERDVSTAREDLHALFPAFENTNEKVLAVKDAVVRQALEFERADTANRQAILQLRLETNELSRDLPVLVRTEMSNIGTRLASRLDDTEARGQRELAAVVSAIFSPSSTTFEEFKENANEQIRNWLTS